MAITGKPLAATAGSMIFQQGGNAVDASCAMLAATCTMWDVLSWGGETQALIYNPHTGKVIGINALGVAPTGATPDFFIEKGMTVDLQKVVFQTFAVLSELINGRGESLPILQKN
jgi:gamma-glutamyltranspeptidase/glutathione hydrolase